MDKKLMNLLCDPDSKGSLRVFPFKVEKNSTKHREEIVSGLLVAADKKHVYPIIDGIPVFLEDSIDSEFVRKYEKEILSVKKDIPEFVISPRKKKESFSFSLEWEEHNKNKLETTWGMAVRDRYEQFFIETQTTKDWCKGKLILDAGCGNGLLTEYLTQSGATVIGLDYSTSVFAAHARKKTSNVHFIRGDLQKPPLRKETFDLIISNGVLHHTPNTYKTFVEVAGLVKPKGKFYLWLYRKPEVFLKRYWTYFRHDSKRFIIARLPSKLKNMAVAIYSYGHYVLNKIKKRNQDLSYQDIFIIEYDHLTPRWRHYHTPLELCYWFYLNGFSVPILSSWDWDGGFGVVATKEIQRETSGLNFRKPKEQRKYEYFR